MKNFYRFNITRVALFVALLVGCVFFNSLHHHFHQKINCSKNNTVITRLQQSPSSMKEKNYERQQPARLIPREPSPLDRPSEEELLVFHEAKVLESAEVEGPEPGQKTRMRLLEIPSKYPMLRTEEIIDTKNNNVCSRAEMAADHFLVTLAPGEDPKDFFSKMGEQVTAMTRVSEEVPLYRVDLAVASLEGLPQAL